jgi:hypothetical protein
MQCARNVKAPLSRGLAGLIRPDKMMGMRKTMIKIDTPRPTPLPPPDKADISRMLKLRGDAAISAVGAVKALVANLAKEVTDLERQLQEVDRNFNIPAPADSASNMFAALRAKPEFKGMTDAQILAALSPNKNTR